MSGRDYETMGALVIRPRAEDKYVSALFEQGGTTRGSGPFGPSSVGQSSRSLFRDIPAILSTPAPTQAELGVREKKKKKKKDDEAPPVPTSLFALAGLPPVSDSDEEEEALDVLSTATTQPHLVNPQVHQRAAQLVRRPSEMPKSLELLAEQEWKPKGPKAPGLEGVDRPSAPEPMYMTDAPGSIVLSDEQAQTIAIQEMFGSRGEPDRSNDDYPVFEKLPWTKDGIRRRIKNMYSGYPGEPIEESFRYFLPRFFCCLPAPVVFASYRMAVAMALSTLSGVLLCALMGDGTMSEMPDDVVTLIEMVSAIGLNFLKLIYSPLLFTTMIISVARLYMARHISNTARAVAIHGTFIFTIVLAFVSAITGLTVGSAVMHSWNSASAITAWGSYSGKWAFKPTESGTFNTIFGNSGIVYSIVTDNIFTAFTQGNMVALLMVAYIFGRTSSFQPEKIRPVMIILEAVRDTILASWPRKITPILVGASIFGAFVSRPKFFQQVNALWPFIIADIVAISLITLVFLPLALLVLAQANPISIASCNFIPISTAFGTASSGAAYPLAQYACRSWQILSEEVVDFCLPLLNVINRPGSVTHVCVCVIYHAIIQDKSLSFGQVVSVIMLTPIVTIFGASLPSSSLITQVTVLGAVNLAPDTIYLISTVDWMLDRFRTLLNIWGDIVIAKIIDRYFSMAQVHYLRSNTKKLDTRRSMKTLGALGGKIDLERLDKDLAHVELPEHLRSEKRQGGPTNAYHDTSLSTNIKRSDSDRKKSLYGSS